jgi:2-hydroxychromene-2-carboxylate isomerase
MQVMPRIEFHYDFGSPNAYLVHKVIPSITAKTGIEFEYVPILLGGVFKATNNVSPAVSLKGIKNKPEYQGIETQRFCATTFATSMRCIAACGNRRSSWMKTA